MSDPLPQTALNQLFEDARTYNAWQDAEVEERLLRRLYALTALGPTSANSSPARFVFVRKGPEKERLLSLLAPLNVEKARQAPVIVIVAEDTRFYEEMPRLFPSRPDAGEAFSGNPALAQDTASRNTVLAGGYMIMAARALGLDCGPMSGFSQAGVDAAFFPDGRWKSNFLICLGYGAESGLWPRNPRLPFEDACRLS